MTRLAILALLLLAAFLRIAGLSDLPPGWRDDEIVETTLHARLVLDGERPLFFVQAEGHEPLYHYLSAGTIALLGEGLFQVRLLSAAFGLLGIAALHRLARRWFGGAVALIACAATALSFWSLMYSRVKIRHVSELVFLLLAFYFFREIEATRAPAPRRTAKRQGVGAAVLAGLCLALGLHTYYASRAAPAILAAFVVYLLLFHRRVFTAHWRGYALAFAVAAVLSAPMFYAERAIGGGAERLSVVGAPLKALQSGDARPVIANTLQTLGMFGVTGDPEALYNIPNRPVFDLIGAGLFLAGLLVALRRWRRPEYAFLLLWWFGGLAPAFVSTPAASLGHTITAQPAAYLFPAIAVAAIGERLGRTEKRFTAENAETAEGSNRHLRGLNGRNGSAAILALLLLLPLAARDLRDYFSVWPSTPEVRHLYRANLHEAAEWLRTHPGVQGDIAIATLNVDPRDPLAFALDLPRWGGTPRYFDPARALVFTGGLVSTTLVPGHTPVANYFAAHYEEDLVEAARADAPDGASAFVLYRPRRPDLTPIASGLSFEEPFTNGLMFLGLDAPVEATPGATLQIVTHWQASPIFIPPPLPQPSNPTQTPVGIKAFVHLLDSSGAWVSGADDFAVEPSSLLNGDVILQLHSLSVPADAAPGVYSLAVGLYNPHSGNRARLADGRDSLTVTEVRVTD